MVHSVVKDKSYPHIWNQIEPRDHELKATNVAPGAMIAGGVTLVMKARGHDRFYFWLYVMFRFFVYFFFFHQSSPRNMAPFTPFIWDRRRWWCFLAMRRSKMPLLIMAINLGSVLGCLYLKNFLTEKVKIPKLWIYPFC